MPRSIKKGTTLGVALEIVRQQKNVNPRLVEELEKITAAYKGRDSVFDAFKERRRIEAQRTLFAMVPDTTSFDRLRRGMIDRAWELLDIGQCEACDALLEFVPEKDAEKMLNEYFAEEMPS